MADYIRGTAQFETAHMVGWSTAWKDGYLEAFEGKSEEYVRDFEKGYRHQYETLNMLSWANKLTRQNLQKSGR